MVKDFLTFLFFGFIIYAVSLQCISYVIKMARKKRTRNTRRGHASYDGYFDACMTITGDWSNWDERFYRKQSKRERKMRNRYGNVTDSEKLVKKLIEKKRLKVTINK